MAQRTSEPTVRVDFQNSDAEGRVRLNTRAALEDVAALPGGLNEGLEVWLVDGELSTGGTVAWSHAESIWVATVDWSAVEHHS